jgi:hypothetical protein
MIKCTDCGNELQEDDARSRRKPVDSSLICDIYTLATLCEDCANELDRHETKKLRLRRMIPLILIVVCSATAVSAVIAYLALSR